jgi:hypothetical protein
VCASLSPPRPSGRFSIVIPIGWNIFGVQGHVPAHVHAHAHAHAHHMPHLPPTTGCCGRTCRVTLGLPSSHASRYNFDNILMCRVHTSTLYFLIALEDQCVCVGSHLFFVLCGWTILGKVNVKLRWNCFAANKKGATVVFNIIYSTLHVSEALYVQH